MFDLDRAIADWRMRFEGKESFKGEDIAEMEGHLRQEFADLSGGGLKDDERFLIAVRRLGGAADLSTEFAKVNRATVWRHRFLWMSVGILGWRIVWESAEILNSSFWMLVYQLGSHKSANPLWSLHPFTHLGVRLLAFLPIFILGCWLLPRRNVDGLFRGLQSRRRQAEFIGLCLALVFCDRLMREVNYSLGTNWIRSVSALNPDTMRNLQLSQVFLNLGYELISPYLTILIPKMAILYLAPRRVQLVSTPVAKSGD